MPTSVPLDPITQLIRQGKKEGREEEKKENRVSIYKRKAMRTYLYTYQPSSRHLKLCKKKGKKKEMSESIPGIPRDLLVRPSWVSSPQDTLETRRVRRASSATTRSSIQIRSHPPAEKKESSHLVDQFKEQ